MAEILNPGTVMVWVSLAFFAIYFMASTFLLPLNLSALFLIRILVRLYTDPYPMHPDAIFMEFVVATLEISLAWRMVLKLYEMGVERGLKQARYSREQPKELPLLLAAWYTYWIIVTGRSGYFLVDTFLGKVALHNAVYDDRMSGPEVIVRMMPALVRIIDAIVYT